MSTFLMCAAILFGVLLLARQWPHLASASPAGRSRHETIRFIDGPLAGATTQQQIGRDGLPGFQITPRITRRYDLGGTYTLPYERGLLCDHCHHWHYTEGWTHKNLASAEIETWGQR